MKLSDFEGNYLSSEEKIYRLIELEKEIKEGEVDEEMIPYIDLLNSNKYCVTTQCCYGHNGDNNRIAHIDFRSTLSIECVIDNILRPMENKFGCNIQLLTEQDRLRYCIWMDNSNWQDQMRHLIYLFDSIEKANSIIEIFH